MASLGARAAAAVLAWLCLGAVAVAQLGGSTTPIFGHGGAVQYCPGLEIDNCSTLVALVDLPATGTTVALPSLSLDPPDPPEAPRRQGEDGPQPRVQVRVAITGAADDALHGEPAVARTPTPMLTLALEADAQAQVFVYLARPGAPAWSSEPLAVLVLTAGETELPLATVEQLAVLGDVTLLMISPDATLTGPAAPLTSAETEAATVSLQAAGS